MAYSERYAPVDLKGEMPSDFVLCDAWSLGPPVKMHYVYSVGVTASDTVVNEESDENQHKNVFKCLSNKYKHYVLLVVRIGILRILGIQSAS